MVADPMSRRSRRLSRRTTFATQCDCTGPTITVVTCGKSSRRTGTRTIQVGYRNVMDDTRERRAEDPLSGKPMPPMGLLRRLRFYGQRNGYVYAILSYAGRHSILLWRTVAPLFTAARINRW